MTTDERYFEGLFSELSSQRERIFSLARARRFLRYVGAGSLIWFVGWFILLLGGNDRFPNLLPLALPAGLSLLAMIIHFFVGRDLVRSVPLFRAIYQDASAEESVRGNVRLTLESDGTFAALRQEGICLESWSPELKLQDEVVYNTWFAAGVSNSQFTV